MKKEMKIRLNRTGECLRCGQILQIADYASEQFGLPYVDRTEFIREYNAKHSMPLRVVDGEVSMWVDKYYIAYQLEDGSFGYIYNTRHHIREEIHGWKQAARERQEALALPNDISRIFQRCSSEMFLAGHLCWVEKNFLEKIFQKAAEYTKVDIQMC